MIEILGGLVILAFLTLLCAAVGEAWSRLVDGFGCMDFGDAVFEGIGVVIVAALVLVVAWLIGAWITFMWAVV